MSASGKSSFGGNFSAKFQSHFLKRGARKSHCGLTPALSKQAGPQKEGEHGMMQSRKRPDSITSSRDSTDSGSSGSGSFPGSRDSSCSPATPFAADPSGLPIQRNRPGWHFGADGIEVRKKRLSHYHTREGRGKPVISPEEPSPSSNSNFSTVSACSTSPLLKGQAPTQSSFPPAATSAATGPAPPTELNKSGKLADASAVKKKKSPRYLTWDELIVDENSPPTKLDLSILSGSSSPDLFEEPPIPKPNATVPITSTDLFPDPAGTQRYRLTVLTIPPKSAAQDSDDSDYRITSKEITSPESRIRCKQEYDSETIEFERLSRMMSVLQRRYIAHLALFREERRRGLKSGALGKSDDMIEQSIMKSIRDPVHKTARKRLNQLHVKLRHLSRMMTKYDGKISTVPTPGKK